MQINKRILIYLTHSSYVPYREEFLFINFYRVFFSRRLFYVESFFLCKSVFHLESLFIEDFFDRLF